MGLWCVYVYYGRTINVRNWKNELWSGSYGSITGLYGCRDHRWSILSLACITIWGLI